MLPVALGNEKNLLSLPIHGGALMHQTSYNGSAIAIWSHSPQNIKADLISGRTTNSPCSWPFGAEMVVRRMMRVMKHSVLRPLGSFHTMRFFTAKWKKLHLTSLHIIIINPSNCAFFHCSMKNRTKLLQRLSKFVRFSKVLKQITYNYNGTLHTVRFFTACGFSLFEALPVSKQVH